MEEVRVGVAVGTDGSYGREIMRGIHDYAKAHRPNWRFYVSRQRDIPSLARLGDWRGRGLICAYHAAAELPPLLQAGLSVVSVSSASAESLVAQAIPDQRAVGESAAEHFIERSLLSVAYAGLRGHFGSEVRGAGFREAMLAAGASGCPFIYSSSADVEADRDHLVRHLLELRRPAGVLAFNDSMALEVSIAAAAAGLRVPDDLAIIGVDDDDLICEFADVPITSIDPNARQVGFEAARLLGEVMAAGPGAPRPPTRYVPPIGPIARRSTEVLAIDDPLVAQAVRLIWRHAGDGVGVEEVVERLPTSRRSLERRFAVALGRSPAAEVWRVRLEKARRLLVTTDLPVVQVTARCGFKHQSHLNAMVRRRWNVTPLQLRALHRAPAPPPLEQQRAATGCAAESDTATTAHAGPDDQREPPPLD